MLTRTSWKNKCFECVWANMANVNIHYNFNTGNARHRFETFCYGPLSCKQYKMGSARSVPHNGDSSLDDGTLDEFIVYDRESEDE